MKAYSLDLRERVAAACALGTQTIGQVAIQFSVSDSFVRKLRRRERTTGLLTARGRGRGRGPAPTLDPAAQTQLAACAGQQPDATLGELCIWLAAIGGPAVSQSTVCRALRALDWRRKKKPYMPSSATLTG